MHWNSAFWLNWNWFMFIPMSLATIYRFFTHQDVKKGETQSSTFDLVCRVILAPSILYYTVDSFMLISQPEKLGWCNLSFLLHHIVTVAGFYPSFTIPYMPWFFLLCFPSHCLLIMFPHITNLNYLYLAVILNCMKRLNEEPWVSIKIYWMIFQVGVALLGVPIIMLWWFECKNDMLNI